MPDKESKGVKKVTMKYRHIIMMAIAALTAAGCSHDSADEPGKGGDVPVTEKGTAISFNGEQGGGEMVTRANTATRATTPLSEKATTFTVWGYKNMDTEYSESDLQTVFPGYTVNWQSGSAATTTTNSSGIVYHRNGSSSRGIA